MNADNVCLRKNGRPQLNRSVAYHLENRKFVAFLEKMADELGIEKIDALMEQAHQDEQGITSLVLDNEQEGLYQESRWRTLPRPGIGC